MVCVDFYLIHVHVPNLLETLPIRKPELSEELVPFDLRVLHIAPNEPDNLFDSTLESLNAATSAATNQLDLREPACPYGSQGGPAETAPAQEAWELASELRLSFFDLAELCPCCGPNTTGSVGTQHFFEESCCLDSFESTQDFHRCPADLHVARGKDAS